MWLLATVTHCRLELLAGGNLLVTMDYCQLELLTGDRLLATEDQGRLELQDPVSTDCWLPALSGLDWCSTRVFLDSVRSG